MNEIATIIIWTLIAGLAMPVGAIIACFEHIKPQWLEEELRHTIIAFGGGALLAAVALVLVPESIPHLSVLMVIVVFLSGAATFMGIDTYLNSINRPGSQLAAMLTDFIPEALAMGATFSEHPSVGILLAGIIALQNLPEGFNACRELAATGAFRASRIIGYFFVLALLGPVLGLVGYGWLYAYPSLVAAIMLFGAGGILYLVFQDIAPQVPLEKHWPPPFGAVAGFLLGVVGHMLVHG